jgi:hypothetical protein
VVYTGMVASVDLISDNRPLRCISLLFQAGNLSTIWSTRVRRVDFGSLHIDRGRPRYFTRNDVIGQGNAPFTSITCSSSHLMGEIWHLPRLRLSPEAFSNTVRMRLVIYRSDSSELRKRIRLSAYRDQSRRQWFQQT